MKRQSPHRKSKAAPREPRRFDPPQKRSRIARRLDAGAIAQLARSAWIREGRRPGAERRTFEEVVAQAHATQPVLTKGNNPRNHEFSSRQ